MATPLLARALLAPECVMVLSILWRFVCGPSERFCPSSPTPCVPFIVHLLQANLLTKRRVSRLCERNKSLALACQGVVKRRWGNVVEVVADRLQRDTQQKLHHLFLFITCGEELLNGLLFRIAAFAHKFFYQVHEGIELGIWHRRIGLNCCNDFSGGTEKDFRYLRMCSCAVIAIVLYTCSQQNDLPFSRCEGALLEHCPQPELPFQTFPVIRKKSTHIAT